MLPLPPNFSPPHPNSCRYTRSATLPTEQAKCEHNRILGYAARSQPHSQQTEYIFQMYEGVEMELYFTFFCDRLPCEMGWSPPALPNFVSSSSRAAADIATVVKVSLPTNPSFVYISLLLILAVIAFSEHREQRIMSAPKRQKAVP
jgi:hypothetical protein